ncbi:SMUG2 DNA glycosylase family protein [Niabella aurantiaca]|uniref:SMUG2 DNA glycosylase family protein n=1 Tax=Niabella aurantiaca TaxID=379900 RepID=UPI00036FA55D|nr:SMUG2 DNA glycosylase family protein [Niabella aurantiaca]
MKTIAEKIISFNRKLQYTGPLPKGFGVLNPFRENPETMQVMEQFYHKFYNDQHQRKFIIGINPSRHGAGLTGVPFTDTKRLDKVCGIPMQSVASHEVSSVFLYDVIAQYGGVDRFYGHFYINSPFPLAIVRHAAPGKWLNANYYDDPALFEAVKPFMIKSLRQHIALGLNTDKAYVLGKKNESFISKINKTEHLFGRLITLEHPRFIQQYRSRYKQEYIDKYLAALEDR